MSSIARGPCHKEIVCRRCGDSAADSDDIPPSSEISSRQEDDCYLARQLDDDNMMSIHQHYTSNTNGHDRDRIRKRKRPRRRASIAMVSLAAIVSNNCSAINSVQAFATPYQLHTVSPIQKSTSLNAVHKRLGNHDISTSRASAERANSNNSNKKFVKSRGGKKTNVFEQFTPDYMSSPYDVDLSGDDDGDTSNEEEQSVIKLNNGSTIKKKIPPSQTKYKPPNRVNKSQIITSNKINLRLRTLLKDDTNEQDPLIPDSSPQAANQLALKDSYNKLSEEARRKANEAVKAGNNDDGEEGESVVGDGKVRRVVKKKGNKAKPAIEEGEDEIANSNAVTLASPTRTSSTTTTSRRGRVRATVKETGSDSMGSYIKSLGQHELLYKEDEILLGRQVRILSVLEEKRYELEEELLW